MYVTSIFPSLCLASVITGATTLAQSALGGLAPPVVSVTASVNTLAPLLLASSSGDTNLYVPAARFSYVRVVLPVPVTVVSPSLFATTELSAVFISPTGEVLLPPVLLASTVSVHQRLLPYQLPQ